MEIHGSARKHGVKDDDMQHAVENSLVWIEISDDPFRYLLAGPDRSGNVVEIVIMIIEDRELVIHAMPIRATTRIQLFGGDAK